MGGTILIAHQVAIERILLREFLDSSFYDVVSAASDHETFERLQRGDIDVALVQAGMIPPDAMRQCCVSPPAIVSLVGHSPEARVAALTDGANDVVTWPADARYLLARIRTLIKHRNAEAEATAQRIARQAIGLAEGAAGFAHAKRIAVVSPSAPRGTTWANALARHIPDQVVTLPESAIAAALQNGGRYDAFVLDGLAADRTTLALLANLRTLPSAADAVVLPVFDQTPSLSARALDMSADDVLPHGFAPEELAFRLTRQLRLRDMAKRLRTEAETTLATAMQDPVTGLRSRQFALPQLDRIAAQAQASQSPYCLVVIGIRPISPLPGIAPEEGQLRRIANGILTHLRPTDLATRIGADQFLIALPHTGPAEARRIALRLRGSVERQRLGVAVQTGMAIGQPDGQPAEATFRTAVLNLHAASHETITQDWPAPALPPLREAI
ncbi:diguanylate cyclase domain-containing protein [Pseudoprimorskyibacter insulae]|uniref:diguanylate cyclase n=1 Tax=Pseudoprimorskyibacter insulae TaxID=1695997 RepID=A0A2R8APZ3_9RHOB|nr:diguanylate cyclase [Pseudoprimorskyibacter insulae]SPF78085.1 Response regulator PleD [Pseudoprimorskyibacter insulae]